MEMTLQKLSQILIENGHDDLFDHQIDGEILDIDKMRGDFYGGDGDCVVEFIIVNTPEKERLILGKNKKRRCKWVR